MTDSRARLSGVLGATAAVALTLASLLPTSWVPRTGLGWEDDHFIVYFLATMILSLASRRPYVVAIALMICASVLEAAQGLTPDRVPDFIAAVSGAAGVISAALSVVILIRARMLLAKGGYLTSCRAWFRSRPAHKWILQAQSLRHEFPTLPPPRGFSPSASANGDMAGSLWIEPRTEAEVSVPI